MSQKTWNPSPSQEAALNLRDKMLLISAAAGIVLRILGQELLSMAASCAVCLMLLLYWVTHLILKKKY